MLEDSELYAEKQFHKGICHETPSAESHEERNRLRDEAWLQHDEESEEEEDGRYYPVSHRHDGELSRLHERHELVEGTEKNHRAEDDVEHILQSAGHDDENESENDASASGDREEGSGLNKFVALGIEDLRLSGMFLLMQVTSP